MPIKFSQFTNRTSNTSGTTIVGFDGNQNIKILSSDLLSGFINGTIHTLPVFTAANTIGDSIVSQDADATQLFVNGKVGIGRTLLPGGPDLEVYSTGNPFADIRSVQAGGSSFQGARIYLTAEDTVANKQGQVDINIHGPSNSTDAYSFEIANTSNPTPTTGGDIFFSSRPAGNTIELVRFKEDGQVKFNGYGSGAFTGAAEKTLAVDANGNIIETPGVTVDGSGTANYITKWLDQDTITDSIIYEDTDGHVGIGVPGVTPDPKHKFEVYDNRAENAAGDYSMIVSSELASPFSNGAGGLKVQLSTDAGSTFPNAISLVTGTTSSELMATNKLAFFSNSDLNTSSATGFGGFVTHDGTDPHWQLGGAVSDSAPSETLFVDGQTRGRSSSFPVYLLERETTITGDGTFTSPITGIASGFHLRTNSSGTIQDGFGGGMIFSLTDAGSNSNVAARIYARRDGGDTMGALQFWGGLDGTSEFLTLRTSGSNLNTNLGINTTTFASQGGTSPNLRVSDDGSNPGVLDLYRNDNSISAGEIAGILQYSVKHDSNFAISSIEVETAGAAGTGKTGGGIMKFKTCTNNPADVPVEAMRINEDGRVGIQVTDFSSNVSTPDLRVGSKAGVNNPGVIDIIRKDGAVVAGDDVGTLQFTVDDDSNYVVSQIKSITAVDSGSGVSGGGILTFNTSGQQSGNTPQERMRITQTGKVGINENDPSSNLHVVGSQFDAYAADFEGDVRVKGDSATLTVEDTNTSTSTFALIEMKGKGIMGSNTAFLRTDSDGDFSISNNTSSSTTSFTDTTVGNLISSNNGSNGNDSIFEATNSNGPTTGAVTMLFKANTDSQTGQYNEVGIEVDRMDGWAFSSTKRGKMRLQTGGNDHITMQTSVSEFGSNSFTTFHNNSTFTGSITASNGIYIGGTGSANYFDDYEEGTWTPSLYNTGGIGVTYNTQQAEYIKVGRIVHIKGYISVQTMGYNSGSGTFGMNVPFSVDTSNGTAYGFFQPTTNKFVTNGSTSNFKDTYNVKLKFEGAQAALQCKFELPSSSYGGSTTDANGNFLPAGSGSSGATFYFSAVYTSQT